MMAMDMAASTCACNLVQTTPLYTSRLGDGFVAAHFKIRLPNVTDQTTPLYTSSKLQPVDHGVVWWLVTLDDDMFPPVES